MRYSLLQLAGSLTYIQATFASLSVEAQVNPSKPVILADTNRDGIVDNLDQVNKLEWNNQAGAIFLPNVGDELNRCSTPDFVSDSLSNEELAACHDSAGDTLFAPSLAAPLVTLPLAQVSPNAIGKVFSEPASSINNVRLFWLQGADRTKPSSWTLVNGEIEFNSTSLTNGITLAIDGRGLVTDSSIWDGLVKVVFQVQDGDKISSDAVTLKQAPVLLHHHLQGPKHIFTTSGKNQTTENQTRFVANLKQLLDKFETTSGPLPLTEFNQSNRPFEVWAQDLFEPAFASMPGPNGGTISIRINLRSAQGTRVAGRQIFTQLRGPGVGGFQPGRGSGYGWEEVNSGGNIETIPPYTSKSGNKYPMGRVITGKHFNQHPAKSMMQFIESQGFQNPLLLEAGWLAVGHVDEMVQFLPYTNDLGFTIAIADTAAGLNIFKNAQVNSHGTVKASSFDGDVPTHIGPIPLDPILKNETIDSVMANQDFLDANAYAQRYLDHNLQLLLNEIPLDPKDVLRMPVLFKRVNVQLPSPGNGLPPRNRPPPPGEMKVLSFYPEVINGLVLGKDYIAPNTWGPIVNGKDILKEAAVELYSKAGMKVSWLDDYLSHHLYGGEVHCGTNTWRDANVKWWQ